MGGKKTAGAAQIILGIAGFFITLLALIRIALAWVQDFQLPADLAIYRWAVIGMGVFLVSWVWSLLTSLELLRETQEPESSSHQQQRQL